MSPRDLVDRLREERPVASEELRERVREIARSEPPRRRTFTWRRTAVVLVPVAAALAVAVALPRGDSPAPDATQSTANADVSGRASAGGDAAAPEAAEKATELQAASAPPPALPELPAGEDPGTVTLELRVADGAEAAAQAVEIAATLGGDAPESSAGRVVLRVPRERVPEAVRMLAALGALTSVASDEGDAGDADATVVVRLVADPSAGVPEEPVP